MKHTSPTPIKTIDPFFVTKEATTYAWLALKLFSVLLIFYCLFSLSLNLKQDFNRIYTAEIIQLRREIDQCRNQYYINQCDP